MEKKHLKINKFKVYFIQSIVMLAFVLVLSLFGSSKSFWQHGTKISAENSIVYAKEDKGGADVSTSDAVKTAERAGTGSGEHAGMLDDKQQITKNKIVVIDAGHGGSDTGTYSRDETVIEKKCTLKIVKQLKKMLDDVDGIDVYYTRLEDKNVSKEKRLKLAHDKKADLFISVHCNAGNWGDNSSYGVEALYSNRKYKGAVITGKKLAKKLSSNVSSAVGGRDRGIRRREDLYLLGHSKLPVSIIEVGYMSSSKDLKYIKSEKGQKKIAGAIRDAIVDVLK